MFIVFITEIQHIQAIGDHGQIVQQHAVLEFKQGQERARMMLKTLADHSLSKKLVAYLQLIGGHGQVALQHAIVALEPEREHVLTMNQTQAMSQKLSRKLATFKNAVMTLGQHGVHGIHVPIMGPFHLNDGDRDVNSSKYRRVHKRVNRFKLNLKRRIVKIQ